MGDNSRGTIYAILQLTKSNITKISKILATALPVGGECWSIKV